jgi:hypothetical protein
MHNSGSLITEKCSKIDAGSEIDTAAQIGGKGSGADHLHPYLAPLLTVRELHQKRSERSCLHAELDIRDSQVDCRSDNPLMFWQCTKCVESLWRLSALFCDLLPFAISGPKHQHRLADQIWIRSCIV